MEKYIIILAFVILAACREKVSQENTDIPTVNGDRVTVNKQQAELAGIVSGSLEKKTLSDILSCNGYVRVPPRGQVTVSLPMEAYVREIHFHWGARIEKGDLLAVMEHPGFLNLQKDFIETRNNLVLLKEDLDRQEALAKENAASAKTLTAARTKYENTLAGYASLGEQLKLLELDPEQITIQNMESRIEIRAPVAGYIQHHDIRIGELIHPGESIAEMVDISRLNLHLVIYEKDIRKIKPGQQVEFTTEIPGKTYHGEIHTRGKTIDPESRSVDVHAHITDADENLLSGMYVKALVLTGQSNVYAIPGTGVVNEAEKAYIFIRRGHDFYRKAVETGLRKDGYVEILKPERLLGEEIVLAGAYYLNAELGGGED